MSKTSLSVLLLFTASILHRISASCQNVKVDRSKVRPIPSASLTVDFDVKPHWVISGREAVACCSAVTYSGGYLAWRVTSLYSMIDWEEEVDYNISTIVNAPSGAFKYKHDPVFPIDYELKFIFLRSTLTIKTNDLGLNSTITCSVGREQDFEPFTSEKHTDDKLVVVYYPPRRPKLKVFYNKPPAGIYSEHRFEAKCSAVIGSLGNITWTFNDLNNTKGVPELKVGLEQVSLTGELKEHMGVNDRNVKFIKGQGHHLTSTIHVITTYLFDGSRLVCKINSDPTFDKFVAHEKTQMEVSSLPFKILYLPRRPHLDESVKMPGFRDLGTEFEDIKCYANVGTGGSLYMSWKTKVIDWAAVYNTTGEVTIVRDNDKVDFQIFLYYIKDDLARGPFMAFQAVYKVSEDRRDVPGVQCKVIPAGYTIHDEEKHLTVREKLRSRKHPFIGSRLPHWLTAPFAAVAFLVSAMAISYVFRSEGATDLWSQGEADEPAINLGPSYTKEGQE